MPVQPEAVTSNPKHLGVAVDKLVEFSYEELANVTDNFSLANKIGQGGFGAVYYGELRGEVNGYIYLHLLFARSTFQCCENYYQVFLP